jgi:signal transduction histidine kinase
LPVSGEDEFSDLSATFNAMLARLETSFSEQNRLVEALRQMIEQQRRFTADASHELRTPLTVIKANTSLALSGAPSPEESRQSMEDIDRAADAASRLVRDLLLLARSDAGQLGRDTVQLPVREVLSQAIANVKRNGGPPVEIDAGAGLTVRGNEDELVRVFSNLLENAIRYTPAEGHIIVTASSDEGWVRVRIADTGAGIAPEHLPHLGERFYRVDPARTRRGGGTGLGLSICRSIVEAHGGTMSFESQVGKGTTVTVSLPVTPGIPGNSAAPSA